MSVALGKCLTVNIIFNFEKACSVDASFSCLCDPHKLQETSDETLKSLLCKFTFKLKFRHTQKCLARRDRTIDLGADL